MTDLNLFENSKAESLYLSQFIREHFTTDQPLAILEAGCGQNWALNLTGLRYSLTGIDVDADALGIRRKKFNDLDEVIIGDLRYVELPENKFDVIYNAFVLEHIEDAELVLNNFSRWLKPDGIIILKIPDRDSVYGFLARNTPHWSHILYYRFVKKCEHAGKPGYAPYPVVYDESISRDGIREFCLKHNLQLMCELGKNNYIKKRRLSGILVKYAAMMLSIVSLGYLSWQHNDLVFVIKKKI